MTTTNTISKQDKQSTEKLSGWDKAIADAQKSIERLEGAIKTCREMKRAGRPWPGSVPSASTQN